MTFFLLLVNLKSCLVQLNAERTWCSKGPRGCFLRVPHEICSFAFCLVLLLPPAFPGFHEVSQAGEPVESSSLQGPHLLWRKVRGLLLPPCVYVTSQPTLWWIKRNIFIPCPLIPAAWIHDLRRRDVGIYQISLDGWDLLS